MLSALARPCRGRRGGHPLIGTGWWPGNWEKKKKKKLINKYFFTGNRLFPSHVVSVVVLVGAPVEPPELRLDVAHELDPKDVPLPHGGGLR